MKKILFSILIASLFAVNPVQAQLTKAQQKERSEQVKQQRKELDKKASKDARNEAKRLKKEGWKVTPGSLSLEKQVDRSMLMQYELDESGYPLYVIGQAMSIGESYDAAKMQALELARQDAASKLHIEITALVETSIANEQLPENEAASIVKTVSASKSLISQSLGRVITVVEAYRELDNKNKEVLVRVAYNYKMAMESAKKAIRQELEKNGTDLHNELDSKLGW
ncbi:MAG: hypothetical protein IKK16_05095 [Bacteroidaceae bacterium]|nr:hypothetical protein [Bacteroidaceae bacterium]